MTPLIVIMAHRDGQAAFDRHMELWKRHGWPMVVCQPEDAPVKTDLPTFSSHKAERAGPESIGRIRALLTWMLTSPQPFSHLVIFEYDSFCLSKEIYLGRGFFGNLFENFEPPRFMAPIYANPPWIMDADTFLLMSSESAKWPDLLEGGEADRYLSALAWLARVPLLEHRPRGFSRGWIVDGSVGHMREAIYGGATMIHGVKQNWVYRAALDFYDEKAHVGRS